MKDFSFLKVGFIAHRGFHTQEIPENSLSAFQKAIANGCTIEFDVHLLKDNKIVVFHDNNLKRMTGINKDIKDCTYDDLKNIQLLNTKEQIPTFQEVLNLINSQVPIIIELKYDVKKHKLEKELVKILDNYKGKFCVKSFDPFIMRWFQKNRPDYIRGLLVPSTYKNIQQYVSRKMLLLNFCNPDFISCDYKLFDDKKIQKLRMNKMILAWTITNRQDYLEYKTYFDNLICENLDEIIL